MDHLISVCSALLLLLPLGLTPGPAWAQMDSSFCSSTGNASGPSPPVLGRSFEAEVELKLGDGAAWLYMQEYLDSAANMAAVRVWGFPQPATSTLFISDYNSQRYTTIQGGSCMETKLEPTDIFALPFNVNHGKDQVMSAFGGLELGRRSGFRYLGPTTVRNITALAWDSCFYSNSTNQTMHITVFFSDSPWVAPSGEERVPLRNIIRARRHLVGGQVQDTTQQLDFLYFHSNLTDTSVFRAASGLYCQGRQSTRPPPTLPSHFSYRAEVLLPESKTMDAYNIWYDFDANVVRLDSKPLGGIGDVPMLPRREVHDFNAGVSYMVEMLSGECHVVPLSVDSMDTRFLDPGHVTISNPQQLFHLDGGNFVYSGQVVERGVTMDTWTGTRQDFPPGENASSVWEWYFSTSDWLVNQFGPMIRQVPTRLKITLPSVSNTFVHNIFDFTSEKPDPSVFDVTDCYETGDIHYVQLKVSGDVTPAASLPRQFRLAATRSLLITMALTPVRVQRVQMQVSRSEVTIQFTLLGPAPVPGDVKTPKANVTSQNALGALTAVVNAGKFFFDVAAPLTPNKTQAAYRLTGVAGSVTEIDRQSPSPTSPSSSISPSSSSTQAQGPVQPQQGWKIGAVAGLAVGMAVAGTLLGVLVTFLVSHACDRKPKFERFQFDHLRY